MDALTFINMREEEQKEQLYNECIESIGSGLMQIFVTRAMQLKITPEREIDIDKYITIRSKELMEELGGKDKVELLMYAIKGMEK